MMFHTRPGIKKQLDTIHNFSFKNLIVSGCSFTYNHPGYVAESWPYYLRDLGGFDQVLDCSLPGAGNQHISNALLWALINSQPTSQDSLVIVMWSGHERDDYICPGTNIDKSYPYEFKYSKNILSAITGGTHAHASGNTRQMFKDFTLTKNLESRAIENYLYISNTWHTLSNLGYKFLFLKYLDTQLPSRTEDFNINSFLPSTVVTNLENMMEKITDPYTWALQNNQLSADNFHPSPDSHLSWTKNVLVPHLQNKFS